MSGKKNVIIQNSKGNSILCKMLSHINSKCQVMLSAFKVFTHIRGLEKYTLFWYSLRGIAILPLGGRIDASSYGTRMPRALSQTLTVWGVGQGPARKFREGNKPKTRASSLKCFVIAVLALNCSKLRYNFGRIPIKVLCAYNC